MIDVRRASLFTGIAAAVVLAAGAACSSATADQAISEVLPATASPGGVVLLSGRGFAPGGELRLDDRPLEQVTWVNAGLAATVLPADLAPGVHPLQVRFPDGREAVAYLTVAAPPPPPATQPSSPAAQPPSAQPPAAPALPAARPIAPASPAKKDEHGDKGKGGGKGR